MKAQEIIEKLALVPLPEEGGFYRETYRSIGKIPSSALPNHSSERNYATAIYYLLTPTEFSGLHNVKSDEIFHFYAGDPVEMLWLRPNGEAESFVLGSDFMSGHLPQIVVPQGIWQGTKLIKGGEWALLGCTVSPGFDFADFGLKTRDEFLKLFPQHREKVMAYTRAQEE